MSQGAVIEAPHGRSAARPAFRLSFKEANVKRGKSLWGQKKDNTACSGTNSSGASAAGDTPPPTAYEPRASAFEGPPEERYYEFLP